MCYDVKLFYCVPCSMYEFLMCVELQDRVRNRFPYKDNKVYHNVSYYFIIFIAKTHFSLFSIRWNAVQQISVLLFFFTSTISYHSVRDN